MRVFLTGANGWVGSTIVRELMEVGHSVTGLVRSTEKGEALAAGATPVLGAVGDLDVLRGAASEADGVIHTAFGLDFSRIGEMIEEDRTAINTFGDVFAGSDRPIIVTGGLGLLPHGETFTENTRPPIIPDFPRASEQTAFALADRGLSASVVRLSRSTHGLGERTALFPCSPTSPVRRTSPLMSGRDRTCDPPCTGSTPRSCSALRSNGAAAARPITPSPSACRSG